MVANEFRPFETNQFDRCLIVLKKGKKCFKVATAGDNHATYKKGNNNYFLLNQKRCSDLFLTRQYFRRKKAKNLQIYSKFNK